MQRHILSLDCGAKQIKIVHFNRSPNKLGIRGNGRTVALCRSNVEKYIKNSAAFIGKKKSKK